jgi:hypothetical protein
MSNVISSELHHKAHVLVQLKFKTCFTSQMLGVIISQLQTATSCRGKYCELIFPISNISEKWLYISGRNYHLTKILQINFVKLNQTILFNYELLHQLSMFEQSLKFRKEHRNLVAYNQIKFVNNSILCYFIPNTFLHIYIYIYIFLLLCWNMLHQSPKI